ncbi:MAG: A/G-specific adenine glycosylase [Nitrospirae bacterium]|nr:A/G-specific adenine glycosylase [Nitrospirota bacterium]
MRRNTLTPQLIRQFREIIYQHYHKNPRSLPWRKTRNPYRILVSEIMLQQTQVERVLEKYRTFIQSFPDFASLAKAPLHEILKVWQGMGYNRRAIALKRIAEIITKEFRGKLPSSENDLVKLPGIGKYSASAILAFAFGRPTVFIETNIRRVFIHLFFQDREDVKDSDIFPLVEKTLDHTHPREWYCALMDYGVMLKKELENPNRRSAHYKMQTPFQGSNRQVRGLILKLLVKKPDITEPEIIRGIKADQERIKENLSALQKEGFIRRKGKRFVIG